MSVLHAPRVSTAEMIPAHLLRGETEYETRLLLSYVEEARTFLESHAWCVGIRQLLYGVGVGGVIAAFFAQVNVKAVAHEWLWVVVGDVPAAYFSEDRATTPCAALAEYCDGAERWAKAVEQGALGPAQLALRCEATPAAARVVADKVHTLRRLVLPVLCSAAASP